MKDDGQLLLFQAKFWEDDLEDVDPDDGDAIWAEWVTRSHLSASRVIVPVVKSTAGDNVAAWVSKFLLEYPPDAFILDSDSDSDMD